jgi:hypothetical protein
MAKELHLTLGCSKVVSPESPTDQYQTGYTPRMDTIPIIQFIDAEIARLEQAKTLLNGHTTPEKRGRPIGSQAIRTAKPRRGKISPEGRARIAAAQRARWAKAKRG